MVASSIVLLVLAGVLLGNSFGIRLISITQPKLTAAGRVRNLVNQLHADISSAKFVRVGEADQNWFDPCTDSGELRQGNAIQMVPSSDTNAFVRYYLDIPGMRLVRLTNELVAPTVVATGIQTNNSIFAAEDLAGNILTNEQSRMVISFTVGYFQLDGSDTPISSTNLFKSYWLTNRFAWRTR